MAQTANIGAPLTDDERQSVLDYIDNQAGATRACFVSPGHLIDAEYKQAQAAVEKWRAAGSPADNVPDEITAGAAYDGVTNEQEAQQIEQMATGMDTVLAAIRSARLAGKKAARDAADEVALAQARRGADAAYAQIREQYAALARSMPHNRAGESG